MKLNRNTVKIISLVLCLILCLGIFASCKSSDGSTDLSDGADGVGGTLDGIKNDADARPPSDDELSDTTGKVLVENPFVDTSVNPISTFSADVDTASYAYFRKLISKGYNASELKNQFKSSPLRTEEMINYFSYDYPEPAADNIFGAQMSISPTPWNEGSYLMTLGIATAPALEKGENNLVFLIDVSGSMATSDKLPLLKSAFSVLVEGLDERDTVSIVTYSGKEEVVISGCSGDRKDEILAAVNSLTPFGVTNGEAGLTMAYALAQDYFKENGNNRIILASDGDLNVGITSAEELERFVSEKRDTGIFLSVLGFGTGNYKDDTMSALAENGNGVYYYIDGEREAQKVLGEDLLATLYTVAKDVKLQLTFNPEMVSKYRLIGYESRLLDAEDFTDDTKDAGDVGAGHRVTVCYEIMLHDSTEPEGDQTVAQLGIRYKEPTASQSIELNYILTDASISDDAADDEKFIGAVIETAMILNGSAYNARNITLSQVADTLNSLDLSGDVYKAEFRDLINAIK